jgi:hypothetical protein
MKKYLLVLVTLFVSAAQIAVYAQSVNAGPDQTIRAGTVALLKGKARGVNAVIWETSGTGVFSNKYNLRTYYTPGRKDIAEGIVKLTLRDRKRRSVKDDMTLKIISCPSVNILKQADTICGADRGGTYEISALVTGSNYAIQWTSDGTGFFYDDTTATTGFQYSASDAGRGFVTFFIAVTDTLNGCTTARDTLFLKLSDPARISISPDPILECGSSPVTIDGNISGTATTVTWSSSGTGYFSPNPAAITLYYPSLQDRFSEGFSFSGITNDPAGPCTAVSGGGYVMFTGPLVDAGPDITACGTRNGGSVSLDALPNSNAYQIIWSTNGSGSFNDETAFNTAYNFTVADVNMGRIYLYATVTGNSCDSYTDTVQLNLQEAPYLQFPNEYVSACSENPTVFAEVYPYGYQSGGSWTTSGTGTFDDPASISTGYTASAADIENGCAALTYSTRPSGLCPPTSGSMTACFYPCSADAAAKREKKLLSYQSNTGAVKIYPNPAKDVLYVNAGKARSSKNIYTITDVAGKTLPCKWSGNNSLDVSGLSAGTYFLVVVSGSQKQTIMFIKQ